MNHLPVREMVLYKHGVGFFMREGKFTGEEITLTFREDEVNDVLKSLAVFDKAGGHVRGIHYQTPMDIKARLANSSINLSHTASLSDLLRDLRGRQTILEFETTPGTRETVIGRLVGIDTRDKLSAEAARVAVLTEKGRVISHPLDTLRAIDIDDHQAEHDLGYFLDTSMSEDVRRTVTIRLNEAEHKLAVYYVAPSPTWRVSYRMVAESDDSGRAGKALLQGWGLFDNRLDEDLDDVRVTLVAGQPISFIYDLYSSQIPERPTIQEEARVVKQPPEFEAAVAFRGVAMDIEDQGAPAAPAGLSMGEARESALIATQTKASGEMFQYIVTTPVSVKRGESALVPIIGMEISYERELLYNRAKLANHPVAALRFTNDSGLTLERGPATIVEDGDYRGEAILPFTKAGSEIYLPFAVELGVQITERPNHYTETHRLSIKDSAVIYHQYQMHQVTYTINNTTSKALTVTIEAPIRSQYQLFETPQPDAETATMRRWAVKTPAHGTVEFVRTERRRTRHQVQIEKLNYKHLEEFLHKRWLDQAIINELRDLLDTFALIERLEEKRQARLDGRGDIYTKQKNLRENLGTLSPTGKEAGLRDRLLNELEASQDELKAIENEVADFDAQIAEAEARVLALIQSLG